MLAYAGWSGADHVLRVATGVAVSILLARHLGPEQFGVLNLVLSVVLIASAVVPLAADTVVSRELIAKPDRTDEILGSQFALRFAGVILGFVLSVSGVLFLRPDLDHALLIALLAGSSVLFLSAEPISVFLQTQLLANSIVSARLPALSIATLSRVAGISFGMPLWVFVACTTLEAALAAAGLVTAYAYLGRKVSNWRIDWHVMKRLLEDSWPLLASGIAIVLYMRLNVPLIASLSGDAEVGIYVAATRISEAWYFIPTIITAAAQPMILQAMNGDKPQFLLRLEQLYACVAWASIIIACVVSLFSGAIIAILFGPRFENAAPVLAIHAWAGVPVALGLASSQFLLARNLTRISMYRTFIGLLCNVALNILLIPPMGAIGAAISTLISYVVSVFSLWFFKSARSEFFRLLNALSPSAFLSTLRFLHATLKGQPAGIV